MKDISLTIVKRRHDDRHFLSKVLFMVVADDWAEKHGVQGQVRYFVIPVEGADATPMTSSFRNPTVFINEVGFSGPSFVLTNNEELIRFPFSKRAFKGLLFTQVNDERGATLQNMTSLNVYLTFEDVEGVLKESGNFTVQNGRAEAMGQLRPNLMPW
jgi:hypothetical protein